MFSAVQTIGRVADGVLQLVLGNTKASQTKESIIQGQHRMNESEISGAPTSRLRLWRSFLGWILTLVFLWEVVIRTIISTYWQNITLPPSALEEISTILLGMLGLGW